MIEERRKRRMQKVLKTLSLIKHEPGKIVYYIDKCPFPRKGKIHSILIEINDLFSFNIKYKVHDYNGDETILSEKNIFISKEDLLIEINKRVKLHC